MALFTAPKRVERDGRLICFEGEIMSEAEAKRRGLLDEPKAEKAEPKAAPKKAPARKRTTKKAD